MYLPQCKRNKFEMIMFLMDWNSKDRILKSQNKLDIIVENSIKENLIILTIRENSIKIIEIDSLLINRIKDIIKNIKKLLDSLIKIILERKIIFPKSINFSNLPIILTLEKSPNKKHH